MPRRSEFQIHLLADEDGLPVDFRITAGQAAEYQQTVLPLEGREAEAVIADKGYDSTEIVSKIESLGANVANSYYLRSTQASTLEPHTSPESNALR